MKAFASKRFKRITTFTAAFLLAVSTFTAFGPLFLSSENVSALAPAACTTTTNLTTNNLSNWDLSRTRATGHYELASNGLHVWTEGSTSTDKVAGYYTTNFNLSDVGEPAIQYASTTGSQPGMNLSLDINGDGGFDGFLVIESTFAPNWWLSESSIEAQASAPVDNTQPAYRKYWGTPEQWLTAFPNAKIRSVGFSLGSGALGNHVISQLTAGCVNYTFEIPAPNTAPAVSFDTPTPTNGSFVSDVVNVNANATDDYGMGSYYIRFWKNAFESGPANLLQSCYSAPGAFNLGTSTTAECSFDTSTLGDGTTVVLSAQFLDGHQVWGSAMRSFIVDNTDPTITVKSESVGSGNTFKTVSFKLFDAQKIDKVVINGVTKDLSNNTYSDVNGVKPGVFGAIEGSNTIVAYDVAGNTTTYNFTLDTIAPEAPVLAAAGLVSGGSTNSLNVEATWNTPVGDPVKYDYMYWNDIEENPYKEGTPYIEYGITGNARTGAFTEGPGTHHIQVRAIDALGNTSGWSNNFTVIYDTTAPEVDVNGSSSTSTTPTITGTINDNGARVFISIDDAAGVEAVNNQDGTWSYQVVNPLTVGSHSIIVIAQDVAGNNSEPAGADVVVQTILVEEDETTTENPTGTPVAVNIIPTGNTPLITNPAAFAGVLGADTAATDTDNAGEADVEGASTLDNLAALDTDATDGSIFGLAWYWWILILAAIAGLIWGIIAAIRRRGQES